MNPRALVWIAIAAIALFAAFGMVALHLPWWFCIGLSLLVGILIALVHLALDSPHDPTAGDGP